MGIIEKVIGAAGNIVDSVGTIAKSAGAAVEGFVAEKTLLYNREMLLSDLEGDFAEETAKYNQEKSRLEEKIKRRSFFGSDSASERRLIELERQYAETKVAYEAEKARILSKKTRKEHERDMKLEEINFSRSLQLEKHEIINKKCISCSAPLVGKTGSVVCCKYCDTDQTI